MQEINRLKMETGCQWAGGCPYTVLIPECLEFAHLSQDDKHLDIAVFISGYSPHNPANRVKLAREIARCRILCLFHHRFETVSEGHSGYRRGINPAA